MVLYMLLLKQSDHVISTYFLRKVGFLVKTISSIILQRVPPIIELWQANHAKIKIVHPPPKQEFRGSIPASEQLRENCYNGAVTRMGVRFRAGECKVGQGVEAVQVNLTPLISRMH